MPMRDANHYRRQMERCEASVGLTLATSAVYAAEYGACEDAHRHSLRWRQIARRIRDEHGSELDAGTVLSLMDAAPAPTVGRCIRAYVDGRGWTMRRAAALAGMTPAHLGNLVADRQSPSVDTLERLAEAWGCSPHDLIPG